ncbi:potassium transporter peripheral membrane protein [Candidatus Desulfofervidus auxilii]|uniref:Trk system potassium uptake protein TrkA n=1 Tax=Desulfofervidus auxilii TaxID=1621989 RepID=A0A7U4QM03_DESA2|nr:Trk system potassium transporter TrkA [Candidatus Desulfofervidus auxilii]AMM41805.1 potassium transporter peripheral membrane protein [Candidatus Desulfofervidus auxilii]CAD7779683.1 Trk system potassium uptake protein TrkA [Candidatus Methanoperedenaceae archaeon GB50]CAD7782915.1 MAG: Trk system potassium uptake protein TrkA [Candidatus Methanoperedenaceae archaeon GB37]
MNIIIVGAGEVGFHIAHKLSRENDIVIVEKKPEKIKYISEHLDVGAVLGSGSNPAVLEEAGIKSADMLIAVTDSDETNILACLVANFISPHISKASRIRNPEFIRYENLLGRSFLNIDLIINPELEAVKSILKLLEVPGASDVVDFAGELVRIIGIKVDWEQLVGIKLKDLEKKVSHKLLIVAIVRNGQLIIPTGEDKILLNDLIYVISKGEKTCHILEAFGKETKPITKVLIVGGGIVGVTLAFELEKRGIQTKIIEKNPEHCAYLVEKLEKTTVLEGNGTDLTLLREENIQELDYVITVTGEEEQNVMISLLAKALGAKRTLTRINKTSYLPIISAIGLDNIVSPALSAVSALLKHMFQKKVLSVMPLGEDLQAIEVMTTTVSNIIEKPLKKLKFPKGTIVGAIVRNKNVIIPSGETVILPEDRVVIFSTTEAIPKVEKFWR